jgi:hypothetical protein
MKTENRVIKVDYKVLSSVRCKECGRPLKKNSEFKGHTKCYVCFKISQGKTAANIYKIVKGIKTAEVIGRRDFLKEQRANKARYLK